MARRIYKRDAKGRFAPVGKAKKAAAKPAAEKWPSIKDAPKQTKVKYYPGLGWAPVI